MTDNPQRSNDPAATRPGIGNMSLILLPVDQVERAAERFASAMMKDPIHVSFFPDENSRFKKLLALYMYKLASEREQCYVTSRELEGLAVWEPPDGKHSGVPSLKELVTGVGLLFSCGPAAVFRMLRYQIESSRHRKKLTPRPYWYLQVIVVAPEHQNKGFASALIRPFLEEARRTQHDVFLETQNPANVPLYERYGFEVVDRKTLSGKDAVVNFCMLKTPDK